MERILVVEDEKVQRLAYSRILIPEGYSVDEASSGESAIELAASEDYDVVLLDMMMPGINGLDVLTELMKIRPRTKVIMITAFATVDDAVKAVKRGAFDYISKPYNIKELIVTIKQATEEARFEINSEKLDLDFTFSALSNPIRRNIITLLNQNKDMPLMAITRVLEVDDHTKVVFHLRILQESGIIGKDRKRSYYLTQEGAKMFHCLKLFIKYHST